jgi:starch synthase
MTALTGLYIKTAYADDPCFKNAKVVYSLYNDDFKQPFSSKFIDKLKFDGIKDEDITELKGIVDFETLSNFAVRNADGVIQSESSVNKNVLDYVNKTGKNFLSYQDGSENSVDAINNFYENL